MNPTRPTPELIDALRTTAKRLQTDVHYQWSHQGSCNCGHLAQTITHLSKTDLHRAGLERHGDWEDHAEEYCATSGHHIDVVISSMLEIGMTLDDIGYLEKLSSSAVLQRLPLEMRNLQRNKREHVVLYMQTWADMLEEQALANITLPNTDELFSAPSALASVPVPISTPAVFAQILAEVR